MTSANPFDAVAEIYDRARRPYPPRLFDDVFNYLGEHPQEPSAVATVEIGPGTGQATGPLLARGVTVAAVEPGPRLAAFLRNKFAAEQRLLVINERFEDAPLPGGIADLVLAATSFHWVDSDVRYAKTLELLRDGGALAVIGTNQIASSVDRGYFAAAQPIYERYFPGEFVEELPDEDVTPPEVGEVLEQQEFEGVELFRYRWDQQYSTGEYADLVRSYSGTQRLDVAEREAFVGELAAFIESDFEGTVVRPLVLTLLLARKRAG
ncbi:MAG: methyltransferase domain-containing protein [Dehalococcoidia bacterium]|jgi:SAM-dependent methyltransferase|nr:methyltransferase domain-containing protein [Dehalococcoidia bacterium]